MTSVIRLSFYTHFNLFLFFLSCFYIIMRNYSQLKSDFSTILQKEGSKGFMRRPNLNASTFSNQDEDLKQILNEMKQSQSQRSENSEMQVQKRKKDKLQSKPKKKDNSLDQSRRLLKHQMKEMKKQYKQLKKKQKRQSQPKQNKQLSEIEEEDESYRSIKNSDDDIGDGDGDGDGDDGDGDNSDSQNKREKYKWGDFSKFAVEQQQKLSATEQLVQKIIRQALQSHKKQLKNIATVEENLQLQSKQHFFNLKQLLKLEKQSDFSDFMSNPQQYYLRKMTVGVGIGTIIEKYIEALLTANEYIYIENKIVQKRELNISQFLIYEQQTYVPLRNYQNLYFKDSSQSFNFLIDGKFRDKEEMKVLSPQQKQILLQTVKLYLKQKNILVQDNSLVQAIKKQLIHNN